METKFIKDINYTTLEPVLQRINQNNINPSSNITHKYNLMYQDFLKSFYKTLINSNSFLSKHLKCETLKVKYLKKLDSRSFNSYHHEILIKLPSHMYKTGAPVNGFLQIEFTPDASKDDSMTKVIHDWTDSFNFIIPEKFIKWGDRVIMEAFNIESFDSKTIVSLEKFSFCTDKTDLRELNFHIKKRKTEDEFEVRITFVLFFDTFPSAFLEQHNECYGKAWIAVPIVPSNKINSNYKYWRYSFPNAEREILIDQNFLKCVFRLIKLLREAAELVHLSNYHIKTVFLLQVKKQESAYWKKGLSYLFISMICNLQLLIESGVLPFYWNENINLLNNLTSNELEHTKKTLNNFICKIHESFTLKPSIKLEDFFVNLEDDDDILSETMSSCTLKKHRK